MFFTGSLPTTNMMDHSGAGRIITIKMRPYSIEERKLCKNFTSLHSLIDDISFNNLSCEYNINDFYWKFLKLVFQELER